MQFLARAEQTDDLPISQLEVGGRVSLESGVAPRGRFVLLVDPTGERFTWMEGAVGEPHLPLCARTTEEAIFLMQSAAVELVLAGAEVCSSNFLSAVTARGLSHSCVFLANAQEVERLSDAYAAQHTFRVLSSDESIDTVRAFVQSLLFPREETRRLLSGIFAELTPVGRETLPCTVLDLSHRGFSVRVDAQHELLLPGTRMSRVVFYRDRERLLDEVTAIVRYVEMLAPGAGEGVAYKVGLELRPASPPGGVEGSVLTEPARILATLRDGLSRGALTVALADARELVALAPCAAVDAKAGEIVVDGASRLDIERGDVVECRFEATGTSYSFLASVQRAPAPPGASFTLRMPRALRTVKQRRSARFRPSAEIPVLVSLTSPFTGRLGARPAVNITGSGAAFPVSGGDELLPIGARIPRLTLRFTDGTELSCRAAVRTLVPGKEPGEMICGVEFVDLHRRDQARIADAIVHAARPDLQDGTGTSFADLWTFLFEARFLYPEKLASLKVDVIEQTMSLLLSRPNDVLKTSLLVKEGHIEGHVAGVHTYRRTWSLQHLAARVTGKSTMTRGRLLSLAIVEYLEQLPDIEWVKIWYRPTNKWPARVYGGYAKKLAVPALSHHKVYGYAVSGTDAPYAPDPGMTVRPATPADHPRIEAHFVASRDAVLLRSDDLTSPHLLLDEVSAVYRELGLERRREVLVAERNGHFMGFALLEISSQGLNFSELTNTFRVFAGGGERAKRALIARARERYRELGFDRAIGLTDDATIDAFTLLGFEKVKEYACWTWHRSQSQDFLKHVQKLGV